MPLVIGTRLGPYEIAAAIGAGGMGEVYRARDTKLDRAVAIKILPESFAHDPERLARFEREAKTVAALNHPNIGQIYGLEESDGTRALVLELVEGPTLADRIAEGPVPLDEALPIARQIAEALEAAHEHGIVHRDLKPANIKLRPDGTVKVLDFGLAKAMEPGTSSPGVSMSPTITSPAGMTGMGVILGTAAYMAPEQARGKAVDKRADIWAFGCVLFEMLTTRRPFDGEDVAETVGAIIHKEPPWSVLPSGTPPVVRRLLQRCLEKDPKQRLRDIGDARFEIDSALQAPADVETTAGGSAPASRFRNAFAGWLVAVPLGLFAAAIVFVQLTERPPDPAPAVRFEIPPPETTTFVTGGIVSPDGRLVAFGARDDRGLVSIWVRALDSLEARPLAGTERTVGLTFFWSPDSRFIGYAAAGQTLKKVDVSGGPPQTLANLDGAWAGGDWSRAGVVIFAVQGRGLRQVSSDGGTTSVLTSVDRAREPFDATRIELTAEAVPLAEGLSEVGPRAFSASTTGVLAFRSGGAATGSRLIWFDRQGKSLGEIGSRALYGDVVLAPDEKTLVVSQREPRSDTVHLWTVDLQRHVPSRLNPGDERDAAPAVSRDGRIVFTSGVTGDLYVRSATGAGDPELLWKSTNAKFPGDWSADRPLRHLRRPGTGWASRFVGAPAHG